MSGHHHSKQKHIDELVLVVHGVGDPNPGETLSLFARSVAESQHPLTEHQEILWLGDEQDHDRDVKTFSAHLRHLEFQGNHATLAEVYWGDLSRVSRGAVGIVLGIIQIIFGLRYVAFVAAHQKNFCANFLQYLGLASSKILHGPVLAVNFLLACMMLTMAGTEILWPGSSHLPGWASTLVVCSLMICFLSSFLGLRLSDNPVCHRFWFWVIIAAIFINGLMLVNLLTHTDFALVEYCRVLVVLLSAQWMTLVAVLLMMFVFWLLSLMQQDVYKPALHVALVLPAIAVGMWGQALPVLWMSGAKTLDSSLPISTTALANPVPDSHPGHVEAAEAAADPIVNTTPALAALPDRFQNLFEEAVPLVGVQFVMMILLATALIIQLARYLSWREKMTVDDYQAGRRAPRLIVNGSLQFLAGKFAMIGVGLLIYLAWHEFQGHRHQDDALCCWLAEANKYAIGLLVPISGLLILSIRYLRPGLDIILDVVNHFYFRPATAADQQIDLDQVFDIEEVTFNNGEMYFSRRDAIHRRMKRILEYFRNTVDGNPTLTIVSHSQGSMVAIEVMNDDELYWVSEKFKRVNFITLGSPFCHIYQNYFRHFYPPLDDPFWNNLRSRVENWLNIFRIDDYVGTDFEFPESIPQVRNGSYSNHPVDRRGHQNYWCDRQVLSVIRQHNICQSLSAELSACQHQKQATGSPIHADSQHEPRDAA